MRDFKQKGSRMYKRAKKETMYSVNEELARLARAEGDHELANFYDIDNMLDRQDEEIGKRVEKRLAEPTFPVNPDFGTGKVESIIARLNSDRERRSAGRKTRKNERFNRVPGIIAKLEADRMRRAGVPASDVGLSDARKAQLEKEMKHDNSLPAQYMAEARHLKSSFSDSVYADAYRDAYGKVRSGMSKSYGKVRGWISAAKKRLESTPSKSVAAPTQKIPAAPAGVSPKASQDPDMLDRLGKWYNGLSPTVRNTGIGLLAAGLLGAGGYYAYRKYKGQKKSKERKPGLLPDYQYLTD